MKKNVYSQIIEETKKSIAIQVPYQLKEVKVEKINKNTVIGANINIIGEEECEFYIFGDINLFSEIAKKNHGFEVPMEIIPSYVGELWNFVLAPIIKKIKRLEIEIDISHSIPIEGDRENIEHHDEFGYQVIDGEILLGRLNVYAINKKGEFK